MTGFSDRTVSQRSYGSQRPVTQYDKKRYMNKMHLQPILENEDIEHRLRNFEDQIKQDRKKLERDSQLQRQLEENKKNIDKTLNDMKQAHEESRMAYMRFLIEKLVIRVDKARNNLTTFFKRHFFVGLLTAVYE
jgi:hypothetical protein